MVREDQKLGLSMARFLQAFLDGANQAIQALREYQDKLRENRDGVKRRWEEQGGNQLPYFIDAMFDYSVTLIEAEIEWVGRFIQRIQNNA